MAEPVALQVKPPTPMSLGDMLGLARGAQAYQQEQQMNPLALERARAEAEVATGTVKPKIEQAISSARTSEAGARESEIKLGGTKRQVALEAGASLFPHPIVVEASQLKENATPQERKKASDKLITLINKEFVPRLEAADLTPSEIEHQRMGLVQQAIQAPREFQSHLQRGTALAGGAQTLAGQNLPQNATTSAGQVATKVLGTNQITPMRGGANVNPTSADVELGSEYQKGLASRVTASNAYLQRAQEIEPLLEQFKPGAGTGTYTSIAQKLQAIGAPQALVDQVAGGDLSAVQSMNKFLAQSVIASARQAANGSTYASEVENFLKNNPSVDTDPRALKRFIQFNNKLARVDLLENEALAQAKEKGIYNPGTWQADFQKIAEKQGLLPKTPTKQESGEKQKEQSASQEKSTSQFREGQTGTYNGKKVIYKNGAWSYQ
jgi:hypothetical protein